MEYYDQIYHVVNVLMFWFLFVIWNKKDWINYTFRFFFLVIALVGTFFLLNDFGFIIKM